MDATHDRGLTPRRVVTLCLSLVLGTALTPDSSAQAKQPPTKQGPTKQGKAKKPTWPPISRKDKATGEKNLKLLASKKEDVRFRAIEQLATLGLPFADRLFRSLKDTKHYNKNEQILLVLNQYLKPEHAPLIALHSKHKSTFARQYVLRKLAEFGRKESVPVFRRAQKDKDLEVRYYSALGLVRTEQDQAALGLIFKRCLEEWDDLAEEFDRLLKGSRSAKFNKWFADKLKSDDEHDKVTALRMMRSLAPSDSKVMLKDLLDAEDAIVKKETINTLRVIVDGKQPMPLNKLTVFMVISKAKQWKARL